jgi:hypothetical protein
MNIFYNSHHSPVGAFASFTLGFKGASGGLGIGLAGPACQNVYIGAESAAPGRFDALPFYKLGQDEDPAVAPFADGDISRETTPACDIWRCGDIEFKIYTPFPSVPDMAREAGHASIDPSIVRDALIPAVFAELTLDNAACASPRKAFFGYEGNDPYEGMRRVDGAGVKGVAQGAITGIFTDSPGAECALAFSPDELLAGDITGRLSFGLGTTGLLVLNAKPNEKRVWRFAVCFYRAGTVTCGVEASYMYGRHFKNIEDVAAHALKNFESYKALSAAFDAMIVERGLSPERLFMLSQAIKSYYGSTQLLFDLKAGAPLWVVNEGAYRMMNTLDLAVDHVFFEMLKNPWVVRSVLDQYADRYSYSDEVRDARGEKFPGGICFAHDMGVAGVFSAPGSSSYEMAGRDGCYSYMSQEQLADWILCAGIYWEGAQDGAWLQSRRQTVEMCLQSMLNRDSGNESGRDGVMDLDSCKTGSGAEITTYDNVDTALGRARRNSYLAVKCWAAYLALSKMLTALDLKEPAETAALQAEKCAGTVLKYRRADGTIPALLEDGDPALTLSIAEGLVYPIVMGIFEDMAAAEKYCAFVYALKKHFETALSAGCRFENGGWKMSKTSDNSWLSKTFLCQFLAEKVFKLPPDTEADKAHASWLLDPDNAMLAFSDQIKAGKIGGSAYYPRGVTGILWLY